MFYIYSFLVFFSVATTKVNIMASAVSGESAAESSPVNLTQLFHKEEIIPDIIDSIGTIELEVSYFK